MQLTIVKGRSKLEKAKWEPTDQMENGNSQNGSAHFAHIFWLGHHQKRWRWGRCLLMLFDQFGSAARNSLAFARKWLAQRGTVGGGRNGKGAGNGWKCGRMNWIWLIRSKGGIIFSIKWLIGIKVKLPKLEGKFFNLSQVYFYYYWQMLYLMGLCWWNKYFRIIENSKIKQKRKRFRMGGRRRIFPWATSIYLCLQSIN